MNTILMDNAGIIPENMLFGKQSFISKLAKRFSKKNKWLKVNVRVSLSKLDLGADEQ